MRFLPDLCKNDSLTGRAFVECDTQSCNLVVDMEDSNKTSELLVEPLSLERIDTLSGLCKVGFSPPGFCVLSHFGIALTCSPRRAITSFEV